MLWEISGKIKAVAELFGMIHGEHPLSEEVFYGLSHILMDLGKDIDKVRSGELSEPHLTDNSPLTEEGAGHESNS